MKHVEIFAIGFVAFVIPFLIYCIFMLFATVATDFGVATMLVALLGTIIGIILMYAIGAFVHSKL